jgi:hypothetical protein
MARAIHDKDAVEVMYPCGHKITIPNAAIHRAKGVSNAAPAQCPTCVQVQLSQKWVDQEEAKLWREDPNWPGFPPLNPDAYHRMMYGPNGRVEKGPLAWLDYQVEGVRRRAWS